jgi:hypothetical protein
MAKKEEKFEILMEVSASQMKKTKEMADKILKNKGIEPSSYWYEKYHELVMENLEYLVDKKD